jgi:methylisocitrate lyase
LPKEQARSAGQRPEWSEVIMTSPGARLQAAWSNRPIMIPGAFNALTAKLAERLGFAAVYLSGGALSAGWAGLPDIGLLTATEFAAQAAMLARATALPVLCDADTGFGEAIHVERTVRLFEEAGAAGLHLEDQVMPKRCGHLSGKAVVDAGTMAAKIRAARAARRDAGFVIVARTDARSVEGFDAAVARARAYREAGADMIFPEALESAEEFARFAQAVPAPLLANMTEFGRSPLLGFDELAGLGYRAVLYPLTAFRAAMHAAEEMLKALRDQGTQRDRLDQMQSRSELYELLGYSDWEARDRAYFGTSGHSAPPDPKPTR